MTPARYLAPCGACGTLVLRALGCDHWDPDKPVKPNSRAKQRAEKRALVENFKKMMTRETSIS